MKEVWFHHLLLKDFNDGRANMCIVHVIVHDKLSTSHLQQGGKSCSVYNIELILWLANVVIKKIALSSQVTSYNIFFEFWHSKNQFGSSAIIKAWPDHRISLQPQWTELRWTLKFGAATELKKKKIINEMSMNELSRLLFSICRWNIFLSVTESNVLRVIVATCSICCRFVKQFCKIINKLSLFSFFLGSEVSA